jgi:hypothetical protein
VLIERKLNGWKHLAEFYDETSSSKRMDGLQTACKTILPKVDSESVENVILSQQQETPQEQLPATVEEFTDGSRNHEDVEKDMPTEKGVSVIEPSSKENWLKWYRR